MKQTQLPQHGYDLLRAPHPLPGVTDDPSCVVLLGPGALLFISFI
jgi:hypothetical protein